MRLHAVTQDAIALLGGGTSWHRQGGTVRISHRSTPNHMARLHRKMPTAAGPSCEMAATADMPASIMELTLDIAVGRLPS